MPYQHSHRTVTTTPQPPMAVPELDAYLIDDEFDGLLDRDLAAIRETLADFRNY